MMSMMREQAIRIQHLPSGETVLVDTNGNLRDAADYRLKRRAMNLLRSRLWAAANGLGRSDEVVSDVQLDEGNEYPHELEPERDFAIGFGDES